MMMIPLYYSSFPFGSDVLILTPAVVAKISDLPRSLSIKLNRFCFEAERVKRITIKNYSGISGRQ